MFLKGGCHCDAVCYEIDAPDQLQCQECNCSICSKSGFLHLIVPQSAFRLLKGKDALSTYTFNTDVAQHYFCKVCGIKSFYVPRSNPDGFDVNIRCLEPFPENVIIESFDGRHWEDHAHELRHLSEEN